MQHTITYRNTSGYHYKEYTFEIDYTELTVVTKWGRIGTSLSSKRHVFRSRSSMFDFLSKTRSDRLKHGYHLHAEGKGSPEVLNIPNDFEADIEELRALDMAN